MIEIEVQYQISGIKNYFYTKEDLESFSTERLVRFIHHNQMYRHDTYGMSPHFCEMHDKGIIEVEADWGGDNDLRAYYWADKKELKDVLKTRPNIPNKVQKKQMIKDNIAQNKKKTKRNLKYSSK